MIRPASEMSGEVTSIPAAPAKASITGSSENVASAGASSVKVYSIVGLFSLMLSPGLLPPVLPARSCRPRRLAAPPDQGLVRGAAGR
jgi:hypothetical protein